MPAIYLHIPFCKQACHYCNFHFSTSLRYKDDVVKALCKEAVLQKDYTGKEIIDTIYFGGGTPSLLGLDDLQQILQTIRDHFPVDAHAEITLEANPDDITAKKLQDWKSAGINRLSMGVQSFFEEDLQWMNRAHHATEALSSIKLALDYFDNITIDLIYGSPGFSNEKWKQNVQTAIDLGIPHLSCYALTVEPKTPLDKLIRQKEKQDVDPDLQSAQFLLLMEWMAAAGYEHYEISNFAKPGWRSKHNSAYWQGKTYLGLGPSAHSFNGSERQWNVSNNNLYVTAIQKGELPAEKETLSPVQQLNEYIMTALRTMEGIRINILQEKHAVDISAFRKKAAGYIHTGHIIEQNGSFILTNEGKLLADGIASSLFV